MRHKCIDVLNDDERPDNSRIQEEYTCNQIFSVIDLIWICVSPEIHLRVEFESWNEKFTQFSWSWMERVISRPFVLDSASSSYDFQISGSEKQTQRQLD